MPKIIKETGSHVLVWGFFKNPASKLSIDPESLDITVLLPDSTTIHKTYPTDPEIVRDNIGQFYYNLALDIEGTYHWKWVAASQPDAVVIKGQLDSVSSVDF